MDERIISPALQNDDVSQDLSLRPRKLKEFIGQTPLKESMGIFIQAALERKEALDHVLFFGPPGLGKTTLAHIIASELGVNVKHTSGPALERPADLVGILTGLEEKDVLFIDEIHRLGRIVEEYLYPAMEDFVIDIIIDKGPAARSVKLNLPKFTLIGATTRSGLLTSPLRERFGITQRLEFYPHEDLFQICMRSSKILNIHINEEGGWEIARRSRGTPRIANRLLKRVRDYAQVKYDSKINKSIADEAMRMLGVDEKGLDDMDRKILKYILKKFDGGPVGINNLAVSLGEDPETIEEVYEPFLIVEGLLQRTPQGRKITKTGCAYLGEKTPHALQNEIWNQT